MAARRGIAVIGVDPACTSRWGNQHWRKPLQQQTSDPVTAPPWCGGCDRATWPRPGDQASPGRTPRRQSTAAGKPPTRPDDQPNTPHRDGAVVPAHRPAHSDEASRSTGQHPRRRPTPFGPHRTHSYSPTRNGSYPDVMANGGCRSLNIRKCRVLRVASRRPSTSAVAAMSSRQVRCRYGLADMA